MCDNNDMVIGTRRGKRPAPITGTESTMTTETTTVETTELTFTCAKLGTHFTVFVPQVTVDYFLAYGVKQAGNDTLASINRKNYADDASFRAAAEDKLMAWIDRMESGDVPGSKTPVTTQRAKALAARMEADPAFKAYVLAYAEEQNAATAVAEAA